MLRTSGNCMSQYVCVISLTLCLSLPLSPSLSRLSLSACSLKAARQIKDSVTMAPTFRLSLKAKVSNSMSHLMVDFSRERSQLKSLSFLPVPGTPVIDLSQFLVADNCVTLVWSVPGEDAKIEHFDLEYRCTDQEGAPRGREEHPWMVVEGIQESDYTLSGLP
ncbi:fibronectin type III and SPRY domain-containing protein 1-like isoform X2 [Polyodon spathula]|uniref:fibronectin type III and SPRY domain-containing protein 1-like isoform X2 n=1 Tax=Polyodon spathula TaxID=7913 RepID=UPI001B7D92EC|nr:fibronectin type III and SPRY domain-containing protein 1-like isoform X2 [Polyodon spathula]